jgi:hypothetical protein
MKRRLIPAVILVAFSGCVTAPLERYTLNQSLSVAEMRYQEVMNALAIVAHNPGTLPSYALNSGGVANVTASLSVDEATAWTRAVNGFAQQTFNILGKHSPELSWSLNPVAEEPLLEGAWYACNWAIFGPHPPGSKEFELLRAPELADMVGCSADKSTYHLGVFKSGDPNPIPFGWVGCGLHCAPHGACYVAHCGETFVWVMPENLPELSEFTLILLDIATTDPNWLAQQLARPTVSVDLSLPNATDPKSTITETWSACQDPSGNIIVAPFAEPASLGGHAIEKARLSLYRHYQPPSPGTTGLTTSGVTPRIFRTSPNFTPPSLPPMLPAPQYAPPSSVHIYRY